MNTFFCRAFQCCFAVGARFLPWRTPEVFSGEGSLLRAADILRENGPRPPFVIPSRRQCADEHFRALQEKLDEQDILLSIFSSVEPNPSVETVEKIAAQYKIDSCDCFLVIGGGAPGAGKKAAQLHHVLLLDPVGAGASALRTNTAVDLMEQLPFTVIRGNISEIKTLALGSGKTRGVDADVSDAVSDENLDAAVAFVKDFAQRSHAIVAVTGAIDLVSDGQRCFVIRNGRPEMGKITGTGCQLSGMMTAFVVANPDRRLEAAAAAVCAMGLAGEIAHSRLSPLDGNSTYRNRIIDAIYNMDGAALDKGAKYEVR